MGAPAESVDVARLRRGGFSTWEDHADHFFTAEESASVPLNLRSSARPPLARARTPSSRCPVSARTALPHGAPAASSVRSRNNSRSASAFSPEPQVSGHQVTGSATTAGDRLVIDGAGEAWSLRPSFLAIKSSAFPRKPNPSYRECRNHLCYPSRVMHSCSTERISDDPDGVNAPERFTPARKVSENGNLCASCRCEIGTPGVGLGVEGASIFLKAPFAEAGLVKPSAPPLTSYIRRSSTMAQESE